MAHINLRPIKRIKIRDKIIEMLWQRLLGRFTLHLGRNDAITLHLLFFDDLMQLSLSNTLI
ncbi:MAG: hypothetical protein AAF212_04600 [Verrucomicrobiota bacterium]